MEIYHFRLQSGEHYSLLLDERGIPLDLPLLYSLSLRLRGGSYKIPRAMRRLRDWYRGFGLVGTDPNDAISQGDLVPDDVESVLRRLRRDEAEFACGDGRDPLSAWMWNERVVEWRRFLTWALNRTHWTYGSRYLEMRRAVLEDADRVELFSDHLATLKLDGEEGARGIHRQIFSGREIEALDDVFRREDGEYTRLCPFSPSTALRNHSLFLLFRFGGVRPGEALNTTLEDLPPRETELQRLFRRTTDRLALTINISRRQDDPDDERMEEPRTKRGGRSVEMPDAVFPVLWDLADSLSGHRHTYLLRSSQTGRPLSLTQCRRVVAQIMAAAAKLFEERWPGDEHSLGRRNPYRFRHHRIVETLPIFFPDGPKDPMARERFCGHFGWKDLASADPYIRFWHLHRAQGLTGNLEPVGLDRG